MKKRILSALLSLTLCLGLLPTAALAVDAPGESGGVDQWGNRYQGVQTQPGGASSGSSAGGDDSGYAETLTAAEAESKYGISVSDSYIDFGSHYREYAERSIITKTITIYNHGPYTIDLIYGGHGNGLFNYDNYVVTMHWPAELKPGTYGTIKVDFEPLKVSSGPVEIEARLGLNGYDPELKPYVQLTISDLFTVDYEVKAPGDADAGEIDWDVSADALDFGVEDFPYKEIDGSRINPSYEQKQKELTVTNRGSLPFILEWEVDTSACQHPDAGRIFHDRYDAVQVDPGKTHIITVYANGGSHTQGLVEGCVLKLTAFYPASKERNTLTAEIPLSAKYLYDGGYQILNASETSYGRVKTSDGVDRGPYSGGVYTGNESFIAKEGSSVTFIMTPYNPATHHVSDIKLNGKSVGTGGMVGNTYTLSDIRENYRFEAIFAPGPAPVPVGTAEPAAWAKADVDRAKALGILPVGLQSAYDQPITRGEFCTLADALYTAAKGSQAPADAAVTFTDTTDPAILRMASAKVVNGVGNGVFDPDGKLTREQAATMLSRLSAALGKPLADGEPAFGDSGSVAGWARAAVGQMQISGIMGGTGGNLFSPQLTYTREQSIVTLMRLYGQVK